MRKIITIGYDEDVPSPTDDDCQWSVYSFNRGHIHYRERDDFCPPNIGLRNKLRFGLAFWLDHYEHSLCVWSISGEGIQCPWDTSNGAGIIIWEHNPREIGSKSYKDRINDARQFLETYTDWCNGSCYFYKIESEVDGVKTPLGGCGGFIGSEYIKEEIALYIEPGDEIVFEGDAKWIGDHIILPEGVIGDESVA